MTWTLVTSRVLDIQKEDVPQHTVSCLRTSSKAPRGKAAPFSTAAHSEEISKGDGDHRFQSYTVPCLIKPCYYRKKNQRRLCLSNQVTRIQHASQPCQSGIVVLEVLNLVSACFTNLFDYQLIPHPQRCGFRGGGGTHTSLADRSPFQQHLKRQWSR